MLQNPLNNPTPVGMTRNSRNLTFERINNELHLFRRNRLNRLLYNMVPILILDATQRIPLQFFDESSLLVGKDMFQCLLDNPTAVHLERQSKDVAVHLHREHGLLSLIAVFEELLNNVVAKDIGHELERAGCDLVEHGLFVDTRRSLKFLLNKARSMLISAKFDNMTKDVLLIRSCLKRWLPLVRISYSLQYGTLPASDFEGFGDYPRVVSYLERHVEHQNVLQK